jgi:hypothetical protein
MLFYDIKSGHVKIPARRTNQDKDKYVVVPEIQGAKRKA